MKKAIFATAMVTLVLGAAGFASGSENAKNPAEKKAVMGLTAAQRKDMALAHEKMATCLRSEKPFDECHKEMMKTCKDMMGKGACPMMGEMHGMKAEELKHHGMMENKSSED